MMKQIPVDLIETYDKCSLYTKEMLNTLVPSVLRLRLKNMKKSYEREEKIKEKQHFSLSNNQP